MDIAIDEFIRSLSKARNSAILSNPYRDSDLAENLALYLKAIIKLNQPKVLLVGEAPGYKGCKLTGIPFSSGAIFERYPHPLLQQLAPQLTLKSIESENTATIVWQYLSQKTITPLFWNSFPFHPHPKGNKNKNRAPSAAEIKRGARYLKNLTLIFQPDCIAGIGSKGMLCAQKAFPKRDISYIRHPSFGGKKEFIQGMNAIFDQFKPTKSQ